MWSGDYLVADLAPFRQDCDEAKSKVKIHRIREIVTNHSGKFTFPVDRQGFVEPHTDPEMPELGDASDDDEAPPRPPGSSSDGGGVSTARLDP